MTLRTLHEDFSWVVVLSNAAVGLWALGAHWLDQLRHRSLWWFTAAAQITIFIQVTLGVAVVNVDDIEAPEFHTFYGFVAAITVGIIYSYLKQYRPQMERWRYLLYGLGGLFLMGLAIRAMTLHR